MRVELGRAARMSQRGQSLLGIHGSCPPYSPSMGLRRWTCVYPPSALAPASLMNTRCVPRPCYLTMLASIGACCRIADVRFNHSTLAPASLMSTRYFDRLAIPLCLSSVQGRQLLL